MLIWDIVILLAAGAGGGFVGGVVGVGGGLIFAPVLFFYFQSVGVSHEAVAPLTIGTSLLCTFVVALFSARAQLRKRAVEGKIALFVGVASALAALAMTRYVTTRPWFDADVFQVIFAALLLFVTVQMGFGRGRTAKAEMDGAAVSPAVPAMAPSSERSRRTAELSLTGAVAGAVATAVGVGGGIVLVPAYRKVFGLPIHRAVGTSSATIVLISLSGVLSYVLNGWGLGITPFSAGYVDIGRALFLSIPAALFAPIGVRVSHRLDHVRLNRAFAIVALAVAVRMLLRVFGVL